MVYLFQVKNDFMDYNTSPDYLEKELKAINEFFDKRTEAENPIVLCPFCNTPLEYTNHDCWDEIKCQTEGCLYSSWRGL